MSRLLFSLKLFLLFGNANAGQIALSFDDAPLKSCGVMTSEEKTDRIIDALQRVDVNSAIFFVTTSNISGEDSRRRLNKYVDAGFSLGNHSHTHTSANKLEAHEYLEDIYTSHLVLSDFGNKRKLHRFPYLHYGKNRTDRGIIQKGLKELGYEIGYVTVDNFDWYLNSKLLDAANQDLQINYEKLKRLYVEVLWAAIEFYDQIAVESLGRSPRHVLLLHENELAALFIEDLVRHIRKMGWEIISPKEAYEDPISQAYTPDFSFNKQGRVAAIAAHKGVPIETLRHIGENTDYLDSLIERYGIFSDE